MLCTCTASDCSIDWSHKTTPRNCRHPDCPPPALKEFVKCQVSWSVSAALPCASPCFRACQQDSSEEEDLRMWLTFLERKEDFSSQDIGPPHLIRQDAAVRCNVVCPYSCRAGSRLAMPSNTGLCCTLQRLANTEYVWASTARAPSSLSHGRHMQSRCADGTRSNQTSFN